MLYVPFFHMVICIFSEVYLLFNIIFLGNLEPWELIGEIRALQFYLLGVTQVTVPPTARFLSLVQISYPSSCNYSEMDMNANSYLSLWNAVLMLRRACSQYILNSLGGMKIHFGQILYGCYALLLKVNLCGASPVMSWIGSTEIFEVEYAFALLMDSVLYKS